MQTTHVSLLLRLKQPEPEIAWRRFVELYTPLLFYWAHSVGLHAPDDADLVQDVFAVLVRKLPEFEYDASRSFRGWLRTIVVNQWRDQQRRKATANVIGSGEELDLAELPDPNTDEQFWEREHREQLVARALTVMKAEFEESTWRACWESIVRGRPVNDVAAELGVSRNAVYVAKCRVLRRLRQELSGLLD
jgi:RNA polymerase sigma-70 factor (ECF subfamily)